jgi:hypothetical protein
MFLVSRHLVFRSSLYLTFYPCTLQVPFKYWTRKRSVCDLFYSDIWYLYRHCATTFLMKIKVFLLRICFSCLLFRVPWKYRLSLLNQSIAFLKQPSTRSWPSRQKLSQKFCRARSHGKIYPKVVCNF